MVTVHNPSSDSEQSCGHCQCPRGYILPNVCFNNNYDFWVKDTLMLDSFGILTVEDNRVC